MCIPFLSDLRRGCQKLFYCPILSSCVFPMCINPYILAIIFLTFSSLAFALNSPCYDKLSSRESGFKKGLSKTLLLPHTSSCVFPMCINPHISAIIFLTFSSLAFALNSPCYDKLSSRESGFKYLSVWRNSSHTNQNHQSCFCLSWDIRKSIIITVTLALHFRAKNHLSSLRDLIGKNHYVYYLAFTRYSSSSHCLSRLLPDEHFHFLAESNFGAILFLLQGVTRSVQGQRSYKFD